MKVLIIGQGGREHALVWKLKQSPRVTRLYCAPGNAGIAELATLVPIAENRVDELVRFAKEAGIDLAVVGPEQPLLDGIVDAFETAGLKAFGPGADAALIEGSKGFAKDLMKKYGIPTAAYESFDDYAAALDYVRRKGAPIVIKADGLAAGKGVTVARTLEDAEAALNAAMNQKIYGAAGSRVVIEECLAGEEMSLMAFVDGETVKPMVPAQDHKPVYDHDEGPNTGGMGTYSPVPHIPQTIVDRAIEEILKPTARAMVLEGRPFRGVLYAGLMITSDGPKVIEFNARFGDPETQVVLPRLETDLVEIISAVTEGRLAETEIKWKPDAAVCVVLTAPGYPGSYPKGLPIEGLAKAAEKTGLIFHAGTAAKDDQTVTAGGRVLGVTCTGQTITDARRCAYDAVDRIHFEGMHYRTDIAAKALKNVTD
jgi:phosphoribosylamine--glycine ligase